VKLPEGEIFITMLFAESAVLDISSSIDSHAFGTPQRRLQSRNRRRREDERYSRSSGNELSRCVLPDRPSQETSGQSCTSHDRDCSSSKNIHVSHLVL
jgi:hypothetical protein